MTARSEVADLLVSLLPSDIRVLPYARDIDQPDQSTVMLRIDEVRPSQAASGALAYDFALLLIAKGSTSGPADEELDALLADVLHAITQPGVGITWDKATRATFNDQFPAYEVGVTVTTIKES